MPPSDIPKQIGPYEILGPLGKGGMGTVYKAMQPSLNRIVAIKVLPGDFAAEPERVARFHREAQTVAMLSHPNIVQIIDKGEDQGILYFAMEYVEGTSLDVVLRQRRLSLQETLQVIKQTSRGLGAAHRAGVVHRDLNPRNILVSPTLSVIKLADFGISRVESVARNVGTLTTREMTLGSLHYLAPEQAVDATSVDHRADIYSLGVVFYEMLTGRMPLGKFSLPSELNKDLPSEIDPVVLKCLATEPGDRYATIGQLLEDVDRLEEMLRFQLLDELKGLKRGTSMLFQRGSTSFKRNRGVLMGLGVLLLALIGAGGWLLFGKKESPAPVAVATVDNATPAGNESPVVTEPPANATPTTEENATVATTEPAPAVPAPAPAEPVAKPVEKKAQTAPAETKPAEVKPAVNTKSQNELAQADLEVARGKYDAKLYEQALADARALVEKVPTGNVALDGYLLIARCLEALHRENEAMGAYVEVQTRFKDSPKAAEAAFQQARLVQAGSSKKSADDARKLYDELVAAYPTSPWAARALATKADLERSGKINVRDTELNANVSAALVSYRTLTKSFPDDPVSEKAWWELGQYYEDLKRWDLAVHAYSELGIRFPKTRYDAWYQAGEIYDRRLKDDAKAKEAYRMVPATSSHYKDAQKKIGG
ncbi:MAG: protein kinase [Thermoanaerobaculia bacterium]